jgi:hypothetical protein
MSAKITADFIQEATTFLEKLARKKNLSFANKKLLVTVSIVDAASVILKIVDDTTSAKLDEMLARPIKTLGLSCRTMGPLINNDLNLIGDIVRKTENELLKYRNFGRKTCMEVRLKLQELGLTLDMDIPVGPLERQAILKGSIRPFVTSGVFRLLEDAGMTSVGDLISKTEDELVPMLSHCDLRQFGGPRRFYHWMRASLMRRGLIPRP